MAILNAASPEEILRNIIGRVIHKDDIILTRTATFRDLGADSIDVVQIMVSLEDALDIDFADKELKAIANMGDFIDYIQKKVNEKKK